MVTEADSAASTLREIELQFVRVQAERAQVEQRATFARQRHEDAATRLAAAESEIERLRVEQTSPTADHGAADGDDAAGLAEARAEKARTREAADESRRQVEEATATLQQIRQELSEVRDRHARQVRAADSAAAKQAMLRERLADAESVLAERDAEAARVEAERDELQAEIEKQGQVATAAESKKASAEERLAATEPTSAAARQASDERRDALSSLRAKRDALADLVAAREGVDDAAKQLLDDPASPVDRLVGDCLVVPSEWASAIEAVAGEKIAWLVARDAVGPNVLDALRALAGQVTILPADVRPASSSASHSLLRATEVVEPVEGDAHVRDWLLGDVLLADTLPAQPVAGWTVATRDGEVLFPDGVLRVGKRAGGTISRRAELDRLSQDVTAAEASADEARQQAEAAANEATTARDDLAAAVEHARQRKQDLREVNQRLGSVEASLVRLRQAAAATRERADALRAEQTPTSEALVDADLPAKEAELQDRHDHLAGDAARVADAAREAEADAQAAAVRHAELHARQAALQEAADRAAARRSAARERLHGLSASLDELVAEVARLAAESEDADAALQAVSTGEGDPPELVAARERNASAVTARDAASVAVTEAEQRLLAAREAVATADHDATAAVIRLETHLDRCRNELQLSQEVLEESGDELLVDERGAEAELADLQGRLSRLGGVNPDAEAELEAIEKRQVDVADQAKDVRTAVADLRSLIGDLDEERDVRFRETFEAVRGHFNGLFRKLFGGGRADLALQEVEGDAQPPGVEVVARPPGKRPVRMSQLSGGEKSMASVALLMSLFRARPGPFCILDEVDAALDEANTRRFCALLDDFLGETQFIIVTHSKPTMRSADVLFGVTMPERGVSRRVEVRFGATGDVLVDGGVLRMTQG